MGHGTRPRRPRSDAGRPCNGRCSHALLGLSSTTKAIDEDHGERAVTIVRRQPINAFIRPSHRPALPMLQTPSPGTSRAQALRREMVTIGQRMKVQRARAAQGQQLIVFPAAIEARRARGAELHARPARLPIDPDSFYSGAPSIRRARWRWSAGDPPRGPTGVHGSLSPCRHPYMARARIAIHTHITLERNDVDGGRAAATAPQLLRARGASTSNTRPTWRRCASSTWRANGRRRSSSPFPGQRRRRGGGGRGELRPGPC